MEGGGGREGVHPKERTDVSMLCSPMMDVVGTGMYVPGLPAQPHARGVVMHGAANQTEAIVVSCSSTVVSPLPPSPPRPPYARPPPPPPTICRHRSRTLRLRSDGWPGQTRHDVRRYATIDMQTGLSQVGVFSVWIRVRAVRGEC